MPQRCLLTYYDARCQNIREAFFTSSIYFDPDGIHDLRVEIKQLRALFRVIEWMTPKFRAKKYLRNLRALFKAAGDLRDAHVQQELARTWAKETEVFLNEYYNTLKHKELPARQSFATFTEQFELEKELGVNEKRIKSALKTLSHDDISQKLHKRVTKQLKHILQYGKNGQYSETRLHKLRILTKETRYTLDMTTRCFPELIETADELNHHLRGLHQALGKCHDGDVANAHFDEFQAEFSKQTLSDSETIVHNDEKDYADLHQKIQREKDSHLATFEERWNAFWAFLDDTYPNILSRKP